MIIYTDFKPTKLYIKHHSITGMLYLGKTSFHDPYKYHGSGIRWKSHIKKHGKQYVETLWVSKEFTDPNELYSFAMKLSAMLGIVKSPKWANLIPENGVNGGPANKGISRSTASRIKQSISSKGHKKYSTKNYCKPKSPEHVANMAAASKARRRSYLCTNLITGEVHTMQCMEFVRAFGGDFSTINIAMRHNKPYKHWVFKPN